MKFSLGGALSGAISGASTGAGWAGAGAGALLGGLSAGEEASSASKLAEQQRAQNLADWNMQNAYNSPVQQMARLKAAGLNPMLVYGSGNVTGNSSTAIQTSEVASSYPQGTTSNLLNAFSKLDLSGKKEDVAGKALDNEYKQLQLQLLKARIANYGAGNGVGNSSDVIMKNRKLELQIEKLKKELNKSGFFTERYKDLKELVNNVVNEDLSENAWSNFDLRGWLSGKRDQLRNSSFGQAVRKWKYGS